MSVNTNFYGNESTWINYRRVEEQFLLAKSNPSGTAYGDINQGTISDLTLLNKMDLNEFPDLSVCFAGIGNRTSGLASYGWYSIRDGQKCGQSESGEAPFFIATVSANNYGVYTDTPIYDPEGIQKNQAKICSWGYDKTDKTTHTLGTTGRTALNNYDGCFVPQVRIGSRAITWLICVQAFQPDPDHDGRPIVNTQWAGTLEAYKNQKVSSAEDAKYVHEVYSVITQVSLIPYIYNDANNKSWYRGPIAATIQDGESLYPVVCNNSKITSDIGSGTINVMKFGTARASQEGYANFQTNPTLYQSGNYWEIHPVILSGTIEGLGINGYFSANSKGRNDRNYSSYFLVHDDSKYTVDFELNTSSSVDASSKCWVYAPLSRFGNINQFETYCLRQAAYLGEFFTPSYDAVRDTSATAYSREDMYLGTITNGRTYGSYTHGAANRSQPQFSTKDMIAASSYEPDKPTPPSPSTNPVEPVRPGFSLAAAGCQTYAISNQEFEEIWDDIYGRGEAKWTELLDGLALFGANPLNAILAYRWMPFSLDTTSQEANIVLGNTVVNTAHRYSVITDYNAFYKQDGAFSYNHEKNFINSKHCKCRLWLPFYGFVELPMTQVLSKEIEIAFQYNAPDDIGVWIVSFGNVVYDYYECAPYIEIPITGDNSRQIAIARQQQAINTALTIGGAVLTIGAGVAAGLPGISAFAGMAADAGGLVGGVQALGWLASEAPLEAAGMIGGLGTIGRGVQTAAKAGSQVVQSMTNTANQIGTLATNVPTKAGAAATTFLHLPMRPFIQFYKNILMETANIPEYKKTVGIACEQWGTIASMPENSLLSISNPVFDTSGMSQNEVNMLITALNKFYK